MEAKLYVLSFYTYTQLQLQPTEFVYIRTCTSQINVGRIVYAMY
jgi:hypothetical protein